MNIQAWKIGFPIAGKLYAGSRWLPLGDRRSFEDLFQIPPLEIRKVGDRGFISSTGGLNRGKSEESERITKLAPSFPSINEGIICENVYFNSLLVPLPSFVVTAQDKFFPLSLGLDSSTNKMNARNISAWLVERVVFEYVLITRIGLLGET